MDAIFILATACFLAAEVALTLFDRSLLLTDTYKFPYPLVVTFIQLLVAACLCFLISLFLRLFLLARLFDVYEPLPTGRDDLPTTYDNSLWQKDLLPFPRSRTNSADLDDATKHCLSDDNTSSSQYALLRLRGRLINSWEKRFESSPNSVFVFLACVLAIRLATGNLLLSHVSFPTYALILILALPWSLAIGYHGESGSVMLPAFAGALALSFAAIPLAQPIGILDGFLAAIVTVSDALLAVLAGKVSQQHWNGSQRSPRISSAHGPWSYYLDTLISYILVAKKTIWTITKASFLAAAALFPLLPLSGEVQGINRNCYVLNDGPFWARIMAGIALQTTGLLFYFLVATRASPLTIAFLQTPLCSVVLAILYRHELSPQGWINLSLCWVFCLVRAFQSSDDSSTSSARSSRSCCALLRKIFLSVVLYGAIYQGSYTVEEYLAAGTITLPAFGTLGYKDRIIVNVNTTVLPGYSGDVRDDYLGPRPSPNTFARMDRIMSNCADSITGSGVEDIVHCLAYLNSSADDYFSTPHSEGQHQNSSKSGMRPAFKPRDTPVTSKGTCTGEETLYHTYWTGPASWRFELFIKAYLYTQNLSCSRLWIWLDTDRDANAINNMLYHDAQFQRFHNLLDDNYIVLKQWTIPERIPLPRFSKAISTSHMYKPSNLDAGGDIAVADGVIQDASGMLFLVPDQLYKTVSNPTQVSDLVRFVVLHLHGGVYLDLDVLPLRDLRPLLLPNPASGSDSQTAWAEQWVERSENPGDYNTAILSLPANSSLSSYLLRGGMRMGMNFHPKIIGRMLWKEGRNEELAMLHNAFFDPLVTNLRRQGTRVCTVPCHKNFESSFMGVVDEPENEWSNYYGEPVSNVDGAQASAVAGHGVDVVGTNRTMEHFFRGAFAYHIHNQWWKFPERNSWMDVITQAQDGFFAGKRTNAYGEMWGGSPLEGYDRTSWGWEP